MSRSEPRRVIGLIVNPMAGIGGSVGLAGSDGTEIQAEALARGGAPRAPDRAKRFVEELLRRVPDVLLLTGHRALGGDSAPAGARVEILGADPSEPLNVSADADLPARTADAEVPTSADDTVRLARRLAASGVEVLVFVGGDGTARDVLRGLAPGFTDQLCVGVPGGVKMHSGVFAVTPEDAAAQIGEVLSSVGTARDARSELRDVVDLDEEARRQGFLHTEVYGALRVPLHARMQRGKRSPMQGAASVDGAGIAAALRTQHTGALVFGPGTTVTEVAHHCGVDATLLGFDVLLPGGEVLHDVTGTELERLADSHDLGVVLSPIGGQGFLIGRGNHQLTERVLESLSPEQLFVVSGYEKLGELAGKLRIDAPTIALNAKFRGYRRVLLGPVDSAIVSLE